MSSVATTLTKVNESLPTIIAKTIAIGGCKYRNTPTVDAFNSFKANTFNKYVKNVVPITTNASFQIASKGSEDHFTSINSVIVIGKFMITAIKKIHFIMV